MRDLKLGIIGMSEGNGHPYSWSAIFNGYDKRAMDDCGFPVIPVYLAKQRFPEDTIAGARVTNVWTQSINLSHKISKAAKIENVNESISEMIPQIDAALLARDDAENHFRFAKFFLDAGLPVFIDKPLAINMQSAKKILSLEKYLGQIFSCSASRYAEEFDLTNDDLEDMGHLKKIIGYTPNSWEKYAVHLIEPMQRYIPTSSIIENKKVIKTPRSHTLNLEYSNDLSVEIHCLKLKKRPIELIFVGEKKEIKVTWQNPFNSFKKSLSTFIDSIRSRKAALTHQDMLRTVNLIELGNTYD